MACGVCGVEGHNRKTCSFAEFVAEAASTGEEPVAKSDLALPLPADAIVVPHNHAWEYTRPSRVAVYVLLDPATGVPAYVGQSSEHWTRFSDHSSYPGNDEMRSWFDRCERKYLTSPRMKIVTVCSRKDATGLEARLIHGLRRSGHRLINKQHNTRSCQCLFR